LDGRQGSIWRSLTRRKILQLDVMSF